MAKHSDGKAKGKGSSNKKREEALKKWDVLYPKALKHVEESLEAEMPCSYCDVNGISSKKDENGKCFKCHGLGKIPDVERRDWAAEEVNSRVAPKPKPVEMTVEQKSDFEEFEKDLEGKSDGEVEKLMQEMGLKVGADTGTSSEESPSS